MSRRAKIFFATAVGSAIITVPWVHMMQDEQRETIRQGPIKDTLRRQQRALTAEQTERQAEYEDQKRLREQYSAEQQVTDVKNIK